MKHQKLLMVMKALLKTLVYLLPVVGPMLEAQKGRIGAKKVEAGKAVLADAERLLRMYDKAKDSHKLDEEEMRFLLGQMSVVVHSLRKAVGDGGILAEKTRQMKGAKQYVARRGESHSGDRGAGGGGIRAGR